MNLRNRLKKLERAGDDSTACACPDTRKFEYITRRDGVETNKTPVPDFCGNCQKPIAKQILLIDFVPAKKPDWMSDEQYAAINSK